MTAIINSSQEATLGGLILLQMLVAVTAVLLLAGVVVVVLRSQSAALRHRVWTLSMAALLALPILMVLLPDLGPAWYSAEVPTDDIGATAYRPDSQSIPIADLSKGLDDARSLVADGPRSRHDAETRNSPPDPIAHQSPQRNRESVSGSNLASPVSVDTPIGELSGPPTDDTLQPAASPLSRDRASSYFWMGVVGIWLAGVAIGLFVFARCRLEASRIVRHAVPVTDTAIVAMKEQLRESAGVGVAVPLLCSPEVAVPLTVGCLRPAVVLPVGYGQWTSERRRVVLAHEMAHVRRRDVLTQLTSRLACVIYWCHPLVWLANWRMRVEREFACDDTVLQMGEVPSQYAGHLVDVAAALRDRPGPPLHAMAMASRSTLEHRVRTILKPHVNRTPVTRRIGRMLVAGTLAVAVVLSLMSPSTSQDAKAKPDAESATANASRGESNQPQATDTHAAAADETPQQPVPRKTALVRGVVVDASERPVAGATVTGDYHLGKVTRTADVAGQFTLEIPSERVGGAMLLASGPRETLGVVILPWETDSAGAMPRQRITLEPPRLVDVEVVNGRGKPITGAKVAVNADGRTVSRAATNDEGRASLAVPKGLPLQFVLAEAGDKGVDYFLFRRPDTPKSDPYQLSQDHGERIVLSLSPTRSLTVRVVDQDGKPVEGARVSPGSLSLPRKGGQANLDVLWMRHTDQNGVVKYDNLPVENEHNLTIWVHKEGLIAKERTKFDPRSTDNEVTATLLSLVPVTGRVVFPDGSPAAGIEVRVAGSGYGHESCRDTTITADDGTFRMNVNPNHYCLFVAGNHQWASQIESRVVLMGKSVEGIELKLQRATRVFGRLTAGDDKVPLKKQYMMLFQREGKDGSRYYDLPEEERLPNPTGSNSGIAPRIVKYTHTDDDGRFEFHAGPGEFYLIGPNEANRPIFAVADEEEVEVNLRAKLKVEGMLKGRVVLQSDPDQGVPEARVSAFAEDFDSRYLRATTDGLGNFEAKRSLSAELIGAFSEDDKLGAIVRSEAAAESVVLPLAPTAVLRGTLIDEETGEPAADREIGASIRVEDNGMFQSAFRRSDTTDEAGRFEITGVVPGHLYRLDVVAERDNDGSPRSWQGVGEAKATKAGTVELGELRLPKPYRPPTIEDHIARAFSDQDNLSARITQRVADAKLAYQQVLLVVADPESNATRQFFESRYDRAESNTGLRQALANYMIFAVDIKQTAFLKDLGVAAPDKDGATIAVLNPDRQVVTKAKFNDLAADGKLDRVRLTEFLTTRRVPLPDADKELAAALATAVREDKRVLVQVSGPGCAPCILLSRYLDSQKELVSKDYVYLKLDSRMPNADEVIGKLREKPEGGVPWMVILSADGKTLITSDSPEGNIGYPSDEPGKAHFELMLRATHQRLSDSEISELLAGLEE